MAEARKVGAVTYREADSDYFAKRGLRRYAGVWSLWALGVGAVISGLAQYAGSVLTKVASGHPSIVKAIFPPFCRWFGDNNYNLDTSSPATQAMMARVALAYEIATSRARLVEAINNAVDMGKEPSPMLRALARLDFPLVITTKVDSNTAPGSRVTAATGALRRGSEEGTHRDRDEVVYITHGRGRAFIGNDTTAVEAGSVTFVPRDTRHGFINDGDGVLEYVIVYTDGASPGAFRRLASRPGPYCPLVPQQRP